MAELKRLADDACMHILSARRHFRQRISRSRQAEPRVVTIMCVPHLYSRLTGDGRRYNAGKPVPCRRGIHRHLVWTGQGTELNAGKWLPCWTGVDFGTHGTKPAGLRCCDFYKRFFGEKTPKYGTFRGEKKVEIAILRLQALACRYNIAGFRNFQLFPVSSSQIWLIPLVANQHSTYLTI